MSTKGIYKLCSWVNYTLTKCSYLASKVCQVLGLIKRVHSDKRRVLYHLPRNKHSRKHRIKLKVHKCSTGHVHSKPCRDLEKEISRIITLRIIEEPERVHLYVKGEKKVGNLCSLGRPQRNKCICENGIGAYSRGDILY